MKPDRLMRPTVVHTTDLFRPHEDPDDHWDLLTSFGLGWAGMIELRAVIIDRPPANHPGRPDVAAVSQLNQITGLSVPCAAGSEQTAERSARSKAIDLLIQVLEEANEPVKIVVCGSCSHVATAARQKRALFAEKCGGVYVNAGAGARSLEDIDEPEYNVRLDAAAFAEMFRLPCPLYWLPCFEKTPPRFQIEEFGTWYCFLQRTMFANMSRSTRNFILSMLKRETDVSWRAVLDRSEDLEALARFGEEKRNMWCTAGFVHAAGMQISRRGELVPLRKGEPKSVFEFLPIRASCTDEGVVSWRAVEPGANQFIFHVTEREDYPQAMTHALIDLVRALP